MVRLHVRDERLEVNSYAIKHVFLWIDIFPPLLSILTKAVKLQVSSHTILFIITFVPSTPLILK